MSVGDHLGASPYYILDSNVPRTSTVSSLACVVLDECEFSRIIHAGQFQVHGLTIAGGLTKCDLWSSDHISFVANHPHGRVKWTRRGLTCKKQPQLVLCQPCKCTTLFTVTLTSLPKQNDESQYSPVFPHFTKLTKTDVGCAPVEELLLTTERMACNYWSQHKGRAYRSTSSPYPSLAMDTHCRNISADYLDVITLLWATAFSRSKQWGGFSDRAYFSKFESNLPLAWPAFSWKQGVRGNIKSHARPCRQSKARSYWLQPSRLFSWIPSSGLVSVGTLFNTKCYAKWTSSQ